MDYMNDFILLVAQAAAPQGGLKQMLVTFGPIAIFIAMIMLFFRSQHKENKKRQDMIAGFKTGDKVLTNGGIHGVISNVKDKTFILKIADNVKIEISKSGIAGLIIKDEKEA